MSPSPAQSQSQAEPQKVPSLLPPVQLLVEQFKDGSVCFAHGSADAPTFVVGPLKSIAIDSGNLIIDFTCRAASSNNGEWLMEENSPIVVAISELNPGEFT